MAKMDECKNRFDKSKCNPWIIERFNGYREIVKAQDKDKVDWTHPIDCPDNADMICNKCKYFEK